MVVAVMVTGNCQRGSPLLVHSDTQPRHSALRFGQQLARHLLLPMNLKKCIEVINQCQIRDLDYGVINDHRSSAPAVMGFDAFVSMKFPGERQVILSLMQKISCARIENKSETYIAGGTRRAPNSIRRSSFPVPTHLSMATMPILPLKHP